MNPQALRHLPRDLDCFPVDAHTFVVRLRTARGDFDKVCIEYSLNKYAWWQERQHEEMTLWLRSTLYDYYTITLRGSDTRLAYLFELTAGDTTHFYSEEGLAETYDHRFSYFSHFQYPFIHPCDVHTVVPWADTAVMYQIFPERFANGGVEKNYINAEWDDKPKPKSFYGGDLPGITQHLDYITDMGFNCVYMTPVFPAISNHKYDIMDYFDVDAGFGGKEALKELIDAAHQRGIRVMLDGVFNHCSNQNPLFIDVVKQGKASPYFDWFFIDGDTVDEEKINYQTFASVPYMPKLNTGHPAVIDYCCDVARHWVEAYGIDGWRLDVMDELSIAFLRRFRAAVKAANPDALVIGELWHDPGVYLRGDQLDGMMNYGLTKALMDYLAFGTRDAVGAADDLIRTLTRVTQPASRMMMNLIGCHDTDRFLTWLKGDTDKLKLAFAILFFFPGIPCVYYGDEIGMEGGYDPDCRRAFPWDKARWSTDIQDTVKQLTKLKTSGTISGEARIYAEGDVLVIERDALRLSVNATAAPQTIILSGEGIALKPLEYRIDAI